MNRVVSLGPYRIFGLVLVGICVFGSFSADTDITDFIDLPSFLISILVPFALWFKFGKNVFSKKPKIREEVISDGLLAVCLTAVIGVTVGLTFMVGFFDDQASIGPAIAVVLLSLTYSFLHLFFIFIPFSKRVIPLYLLSFSFFAFLAALFTFAVLLFSFSV